MIIKILGGITIVLFALVAYIGHANTKGIKFLNVKWHRTIAYLALIIALIHMMFALSN